MNKDYIFLILLLVIISGALLWQNPDTVELYFDKVKAGISLNLKLSEDSGLDLSEINIERLFEADKEDEDEELALTEVFISEEDGIGGPLIGELLEQDVLKQETKQEVVVLEKKSTLEEIEQEVNRIAKEVERIDKEVQILVVLDKTQ